MSPFETYKTYLALKQHFTKQSYDFHKYGGKVSASAKSFDGRRDRYYFEKLAKKRDAFNYLLANMVEDPKIWIGELVTNDNAEQVYKHWLRRNQSLSYTFKEECNKLSETFNFDEMLRPGNGGHPPLLKAYLRKEVSIETFVILIRLSGCYNYWNRKMDYDPVWQSISLIVMKYHAFIKYDNESLREIVIDIFGD